MAEKKPRRSEEETQAINILKQRMVTFLQHGEATLDTMLVTFAPEELGDEVNELLTRAEVPLNSPVRPYYVRMKEVFFELLMKERKISIPHSEGTNYIRLTDKVY